MSQWQRQFRTNPDTPFALSNARIPAGMSKTAGLPVAGDGLQAADLVIDAGRIAWVGPPGTRADLPNAHDLRSAMVWPATVDCHTHLDKGQIWSRRPNPDGTFQGALAASGDDAAERPLPADIRQRAEFQLRAAWAHGTAAIRTHVDASPGGVSLGVLAELARDWQDRIAVQVCPFVGPTSGMSELEDLARWAAQRDGILSAFLYTTPELAAFVEQLFHLADRFGLELDFHADENLDPTSHCLRLVAETAIKRQFQGRILVGHCCALGVQSPDEAARTIELVARAGIGVVTLPLCNAYLMARTAGVTPRDRGFAPVHEMRAAGIPVAIASDNVRDPFYAYGDLDLVEVFRDAMRMMHLDHPVSDWAAATIAVAADLIGLDKGRLDPGSDADLIILSARNWSEFAARPQSNRVVLRAGQPVDTTPPEFSELDDIRGARP